MKLAPCTRAQAPEILAIFNHAILHTTAIYDYEPRTTEFMERWFEAKEREGLPVIGAFDEDGGLAGFASYGSFRAAFPAYRHTMEHSVYVREDRQGRGLGRSLLERIVAEAEARDVHVLVGVIDASNTASISLHRALGFSHAGTLREVGFKFGRWLDVALHQRVLGVEGRRF